MNSRERLINTQIRFYIYDWLQANNKTMQWLVDNTGYDRSTYHAKQIPTRRRAEVIDETLEAGGEFMTLCGYLPWDRRQIQGYSQSELTSALDYVFRREKDGKTNWHENNLNPKKGKKK